MATQEDIDRITTMAQDTEDVAQLKQYRQELVDIAASMAQAYARTSDSGLQQDIAAIRESAEYAAEEIGGRARQLEIDQMDPNYEKRKAERAAFEAQQQARQQEEAKDAMKQLGGLGGLLGGLGGMFGGGQGQQEQATPQPPTTQPSTTTACSSCGQPIEGSPKFCPNCGAPTQATCGSCGQPIEGSPKFCPNCGAPRA